MNLSRARLCLDCEELHEGQICHTCSSASWWPLAKFLERQQACGQARLTDAVATPYVVASADTSRHVRDSFSF